MSDIIERAARVAVESLEAHHEKCRIAVREACGFDLGPAPNRDVEAWIIAGALADAGVLRPEITEEMVEAAAIALHAAFSDDLDGDPPEVEWALHASELLKAACRGAARDALDAALGVTQ